MRQLWARLHVDELERAWQSSKWCGVEAGTESGCLYTRGASPGRCLGLARPVVEEVGQDPARVPPSGEDTAQGVRAIDESTADQLEQALAGTRSRPDQRRLLACSSDHFAGACRREPGETRKGEDDPGAPQRPILERDRAVDAVARRAGGLQRSGLARIGRRDRSLAARVDQRRRPI